MPKLSKRDIGLLWRIRGLYNAAHALYRIAHRLEKDGAYDRLPLADRTLFIGVLHSCARAIAIEEGKQRADKDNYGLDLTDLGKPSLVWKKRRQGEQKPCPQRKTMP